MHKSFLDRHVLVALAVVAVMSSLAFGTVVAQTPDDADVRRPAVETAAPADGEEEKRARDGAVRPGIDAAPIRSPSEDFEREAEGNTDRPVVDAAAVQSQAEALRRNIAAVADAARACEASGLTSEECRWTLKDGFAFEECAARGIASRSSCEAYLASVNGGVFPGCAGRTNAQCRAIKNLLLVNYLPDEAKAEADRLLEEMIRGGFVVAIPGATAFHPGGPTDDLGWWSSPSSGAGETSVGMVVIDTDKDGLPDDFEIANGLDPRAKDTDGDGIDDGDALRAEVEVRGWDPTAKVVILRKPFEQPRGAGAVDGSFGVGVNRAAAGGGNQNWNFEGRCLPNATCIIYLYSYIPMVITVKTDADGRFAYDFQKDLADGSHTAYVAVTDEDGRIVKKSNPLPFFVREARAVSGDDFVAGELGPAKASGGRYLRSYAIGAAMVVLVALGIVWRIGPRSRPPKDLNL